MINKWILNNFKSIDERKEFNFRPLTIFTGANSSGKSTVLQSILLVSQTLQDPISSRSIVLNGSIKKFGSYDDIVFCRQINRDIEIGFSLKGESNQFKFKGRSLNFYHDSLTNLNCEFRISAEEKHDNLQPSLVDLLMKFSAQPAFEQVNLHVDKKKEISDFDRQVMKSLDGRFPDIVYNFRINKEAIGESILGLRAMDNIAGVGLQHFLPDLAITYSSYSDSVKKYIANVLSGKNMNFFEPEKADKSKILKAVKKEALVISDEIKAKKKSDSTFSFFYDRLRKGRFTLNKMEEFLKFSELAKEDLQKFTSRLQDAAAKVVTDRLITVPVPLYFSGCEFVRNYFTDHIKYLGPLREEPKSLYPLESGSSSTDVGLKGENTAAVFENNKDKRISYVDPVCFTDHQNVVLKKVRGKLSEAINKWLLYLGVAGNMETNDKGKYGHELKIVTDVKNLKQDLTHVGVGVSQVLPILVMSLLANEDSVIIIEQPELHLHPKVQTRLADFFSTMNTLGKQCLIETHSEYLINRLRYFIARSEDTKLSDNTMIYFVEKENGYSKYREVTINKYGVIDEWPDGFFDESERLSADILRAGMEKRMMEEKDEEDEE